MAQDLGHFSVTAPQEGLKSIGQLIAICLYQFTIQVSLAKHWIQEQLLKIGGQGFQFGVQGFFI